MKDDCISRTVAIDMIKRCFQPEHRNKEVALQMCVDGLRGLPSVQPERKTGHWNTIDECSNAGTYCSCCNKRVVKEGWSKTVKKIKFCPNCGADMRGEECQQQ